MGTFVSTLRADESVAGLITALRLDLAQHIVPNNDDELTITVRLSAYDMLEILAASPHKVLPEMQKAMAEGLFEVTAATPESQEGFGMTPAEHEEAFPKPKRTTFFHLPPEIRMQIFREVVRSDKIIYLRRHVEHVSYTTMRVIRADCEVARTQRRQRHKAPDLDEETGKLVSTIPSPFTLLRVCRAFYEEAGPIAYGENIFRFDFATTAELFLGGIGSKQLNWLRFVVYYSKADPHEFLQSLTQGLSQNSKLKSVVIPSPVTTAYTIDKAIPPEEKTAKIDSWAAAQIKLVKDYLRLQYTIDPSEANEERLVKLFKVGDTLSQGCSTCEILHCFGIQRKHDCGFGVEFWKRVYKDHDGSQSERLLQNRVREELDVIKTSIKGGKVKVVDETGKEKVKKCRKRKAPMPVDEAEVRALRRSARLAREV